MITCTYAVPATAVDPSSVNIQITLGFSATINVELASPSAGSVRFCRSTQPAEQIATTNSDERTVWVMTAYTGTFVFSSTRPS